MPKFIAITHQGCEGVTKTELKELINADSTSKTATVFFEAEEMDACKFCYKAQTIRRLISHIDNFKAKSFEEILDFAEKSDYPEIPEGKTFVVRCLREGYHDFSSKDVEREIGEIFYKKTGAHADLKNADYRIQVYINESEVSIGIDYSGFDLSKRKYLIFTGPAALKSNIAYTMARLAGFTKDSVLVDPTMKYGSIPIEATLFRLGLSPNFFNKEDLKFPDFITSDKDFEDIFDEWDEESYETEGNGKIYGYEHLLKFVKSAQKNAKIAGVVKETYFSKVDTEWLDTKHHKEEVDCIVSYPPQISRHHPAKAVTKIYGEIFYAAEYNLKQDGKIVLICNHVEELEKQAERYKFKIIESIDLHQGQEILTAHIIVKEQTEQ